MMRMSRGASSQPLSPGTASPAVVRLAPIMRMIAISRRRPVSLGAVVQAWADFVAVVAAAEGDAGDEHGEQAVGTDRLADGVDDHAQAGARNPSRAGEKSSRDRDRCSAVAESQPAAIPSSTAAPTP